MGLEPTTEQAETLAAALAKWNGEPMVSYHEQNAVRVLWPLIRDMVLGLGDPKAEHISHPCGCQMTICAEHIDGSKAYVAATVQRPSLLIWTP